MNPLYTTYPEEDLQFDGNLYIFIGNATSSTANLLSYILKDNNYGTLIGEPTGMSSLSFPKGKKIYYNLICNMENFNISFNITNSLILRANEEARKSEPDAVYPHIYTPITLEDYLNGTDPCWEYLVENVFN